MVWLRCLLFVCLFSSACAARIDPIAKANVDRQVASLSANTQQFDAPTTPEPMPLQPGQWIRVHTVDKEGRHAFMTTKIIGVEGASHWIETETETYYGTSATKMLVDFGDRKDPSTFDIHAYFMRGTDGSVEEYPRELLGILKPTLRKALASAAIAQDASGAEDVTVPAGSFAQAYKARVTTSVLGMQFTSDAWWHPAVPISGALKNIGVDNGTRAELVAFGESGAVSVFP